MTENRLKNFTFIRKTEDNEDVQTSGNQDT